MIRRTMLSVVVAAAFCLSAAAQIELPGTSGLHSVACFKVAPEKASEFHAWAASDLHKLAQSMVDTGILSAWYLLRSVQPQGKSADCDYLTIAFYPGTPPEPLSPEALGDVLKKAGLTMSAQQFLDRRNSLTMLVSNNLFQRRAEVGSTKKGNYIVVNYMKAANVGDWVAFEKKVWQPVAEALIRDGRTSGWSLNVQILPGGSDLPFQGVTVDVFPTWDDVFKPDPQFVERFRKVHPDMEFGMTFQQFEKLRTMVSLQLFAAVDVVTPTKP